MSKVFIQHEYDLIKELQKIIDDTSGSWENAYFRQKKQIKSVIAVLEESVEVMIEK